MTGWRTPESHPGQALGACTFSGTPHYTSYWKKENDTHRFHLPDLTEPGHFPVESVNKQIKLAALYNCGLPYDSLLAHRHMPPLLPAVCVTGYGAQGLTLKQAIVTSRSPHWRLVAGL